MTQPSTIRSTQRLLIGNGALLMFLGGVASSASCSSCSAGSTCGRSRSSTSNYRAVKKPGGCRIWKPSSTGSSCGLALLLPLLPFGGKGLRRVSIGMIGVGWMFSVASLFDAFFPNSRGLQFGGPLTNRIPFFLFYVGIVIVMVVLAMIAWQLPGQKTSRSDRRSTSRQLGGAAIFTIAAP